jgi:O-antigen ligase/tetratricopeptide (TPR) repeat protein
MEGTLLALVCLSPWAYGAVHPGFEFLLNAGVALLLLLWAARILVEGRLTWARCPVAVCLAALFLLGAWQLTPLSDAALERLSPGTARLYGQLLPAHHEVLPGEQERPTARRMLTLEPGATRRELVRLLAVLLVFAVVRNNTSSMASFRRLSLAVLIDGALLSVFALAQFFSSPHHLVYWRYPSLGNVFGPFINRNHFACYVNLCLGLGVGLLLARQPADSPAHAANQGSWRRALLRLLHDPATLWISAALGLMTVGVAFCLSRGGFLALVGGAVVCAAFGLLVVSRGDGRSIHFLAPLVLAAVVGVGLAAWFGTGLVQSRLGTLWNEKALDNRRPVWERSLLIVRAFPQWGTGYGTFEQVEPMFRNEARQEPHIHYEHAHNDYLELLVEGGVGALGLGLLAIAAVYWLGYRALRRTDVSRPEAGLVLGGLFAFTTFVLHSGGDFGAHVPAITLLATVICAHLAARGAAPTIGEYSLRLGGLAPLVAASTLVCLGLLLCAAAWKRHGVDRLQEAARENEAGRIASLARAAALAPDDARLRCELADARAGQYQRETLAGWQGELPPDAQATAVLLDYLQARDACPLLPEAHLGLAIYSDRLERGDEPAAYLSRVKLLAPCRPDLWYRCGLQELRLGQSRQAWASWRHSLELSDEYLPEVLALSAPLVRSDELIDRVLPDRPDVLAAAAFRLHPAAEEQRRPFLEKALRLLDSREGELQPEDLHLKATAHRDLGQADAAVEAYRELLAREPFRLAWREEFARYLHELGRLEDCRHELLVLLAQAPAQDRARELLRAVTDEMLQKKWASDPGKDARRLPSDR